MKFIENLKKIIKNSKLLTHFLAPYLATDSCFFLSSSGSAIAYFTNI